LHKKTQPNYELLLSPTLQVHNCTKCRQCLPKVFQQGSSPSDGETQSKVMLAVPCASALNLLREPCGVPGGSVVEARRCDQPGGHASVPQGLIGDRKASYLAPGLLDTTGSAECCGLHVMVKQARDRQFEELNAQQGYLRMRVVTSSGLTAKEGITRTKCQI
jgi:hypothetical protein